MSELLPAGIVLLAALAICGVPLTAIVVMRETRAIFQSFTDHLDARPAIVGGEPAEVTKDRLDIERAKIELKHAELETNREIASINAGAHAAKLRSIRGEQRLDRVESA